MKITLLVTTFNSLTQMAYTKLKDLGHLVDVVYAIDKEQMIKEVDEFKPDIILSPYLKKFVPKEIYEAYPTFIFHPGIIGDKGAFALDNAIREDKKEWGITIIRANGEFDGGDIYVEVKFKMRNSYKASIYRNEVFFSASKALDMLLDRLDDLDFKPTPQLDTQMHKYLTQKDRAINWESDTTDEILKKIYFSDSYPGVLDEILGVECYLFGGHKEDRLRGKPKEILAKRDGAICLGTIDGAVWISHLMRVGEFKLPATYVLKERLKGVKEDRLPLIFDKSYNTFYEVSCDIDGDIAYLYFNFHNGAFRAEQCMRLKYAFEYIKEQVKVVVLMGGVDFFSNGINLNILEDSQKSGEDGWSNINAINDLVGSVLFASDVITVASLYKNAGAGGVFLATACDYVVAHKDSVLNPHYKTLGLSGSEYHSYTLPKRVGKEMAKRLLDECLPISTSFAKKIGLVDEVYSDDYFKNLKSFCAKLIEDEDRYDDFLWEKEDYLIENEEIINKHKEQELKVMYPEFWDRDSKFHKLRHDFVYKICPLQTPKRLKAKICMNTQ